MEQVLWNIYSTCMTFVPPLRGTFIIGKWFNKSS